MVAITAMPNAYARAAELRKAKTRVSTETISSQLIHGTQIWPIVDADVCAIRSLGR